MPELPEVETIRRQLTTELVGERIRDVVVRGERTVRRPPYDFGNLVQGARVESVNRVGKFLIVGLGDRGALVVHLGMSGRLYLGMDDGALLTHTRASISFAARRLDFIDPRTFGQLFFVSGARGEAPYVDELAHLGPDPLEDWRGASHSLSAVAAKSTRSIKNILLDQRVVAGLGNMYADEVLFRSGIHPETLVATLPQRLMRGVSGAMADVLDEALAYGGSSFPDRSYRDLYGDSGRYLPELFVYLRHGRRCYLCGARIVRDRFGGRHSYRCPCCQPRMLGVLV
ncbi:MAG: bifunctional DNA-formamidopyrimidine glycosylase/DNA-(apurinic or apyrimidinic site) lyase [Ferrimicrobium sp.]